MVKYFEESGFADIDKHQADGTNSLRFSSFYRILPK